MLFIELNSIKTQKNQRRTVHRFGVRVMVCLGTRFSVGIAINRLTLELFSRIPKNFGV